MINWSVENRPLKEQSRKIIAEVSSKNKNLLLVMPGNSGRDVRLLQKHKVGLKRSKWIVVEKKKDVLDSFAKKRLLPNHKTQYYRGLLSSLSLNEIPDFMWLDLCGNLTIKDVLWLKNLTIHEDLDLFITLSVCYRGNVFFKNCLQTLTSKYKSQVDSAIKNDLSRKLLSVPPKHLPIIVAHWQLLQYCLPTAKTNCYVYQDKTTMMLYHLRNFEGRQETFAQEDFDILVGLKQISEEEIITAVLSARGQEIQEVKSRLNSYVHNQADPESARASILEKIELIRRQQISIFS